MYIVEYGKERLHDPRAGLFLPSAEAEIELNAAGSFTFDIYSDHPLYDKIEKRNTKHPVRVWQDDTLLFMGDITSIETCFNLGKKVECRGALGWLNDSIVRPYSTRSEEQGDDAPPAVDKYFEWLIDQHNRQVESKKTFKVGKNEGDRLDDNNYILRSSSEYPSTGEEIQEKILESLGGYVTFREEGGSRYLDFVADFEKVNAQVIDFGVNLLDFVRTETAEDMATFVIPLGAKLSETEYDYDDGHFVTSDSKPVAKKEYFVRQYDKCKAMTAFEDGVTYYEKKQVEFKTSDTKPFSGVDYYLKIWTAQFNKSSVKKNFTEGKTYYEYSSSKGYFITSDSSPKSGKTYYLQISTFRDGTDYYQYSSENGYYKTSHSKPQKGVTYYTMKWEKQSISKFEDGKTYWEKETYYAKTSDSAPISGKDYYILDRNSYSSKSDLGRFLKYETYYEYDENRDESDKRISLSMLDNDQLAVDFVKEDDKIYCESAVAKYGWIGTTVEYNDVTVLSNLQRKGLASMKSMCEPSVSVELSAIDLAMLKPGHEPIFVGQYVRGRAKPHNFDSYLLCTKMTVDLNRPDNNKFELGTTVDVLTGVQNRRIKSLNATINQVYEEAAAISAEAKAAARSAKEANDDLQSTLSTVEDAKAAADAAVVSSVEEFSASTDPTVEPDEGWAEEMPEWEEGIYIWKRTVVTYGDGSQEIGAAVMITGNTGVAGSAGEDATVLRIDSSRGTVFKNSEVATVLSVAIYKGGLRITDVEALRAEFGSTAYLEWYWQRINEETFGVISASDSRISEGGFALTLTPDDVDTKVTFMCQLITD